MIEILLLILGLVGVSLVFIFLHARRTAAYVFCNATISTWEARLLPDARLMEFAELPNVQALLSALGETEYRLQLKETEKEKIDMIEIERAFHEHISGRFKELLELVPRERKDTIKRLLQKADLWNLKTILTMIHNKVPKELRARELIPSPITPPEKLELLSSAGDMTELLEFLKGSEYFDVISKALPDYEKYGLAPLLTALDKHYYSLLWEEVLAKKPQRRILRTVVGFQIDSVNAKLILRLKQEGVPPPEIDRFLIRPSHELSEAMLKAMVMAEDLRSAVHMIHITSVGKVLGVVSEKIEREGVEAAERTLEVHYLKLCRWLGLMNFFSIAPALSYIAQKENEVKNLRVLIRLKADGVSPHEIKETLVRVPKIEL
jgi:ATP synthase A1 C subunit